MSKTNMDKKKEEFDEKFSSQFQLYVDEYRDGGGYFETDAWEDVWSWISTNFVPKEEVEKLLNYVEHTTECILSSWSAGRSTKDGGYEMKFGGKWYQAKPVDKTPKCDCGLDDILKELQDK